MRSIHRGAATDDFIKHTLQLKSLTFSRTDIERAMAVKNIQNSFPKKQGNNSYRLQFVKKDKKSKRKKLKGKRF